MAHLLKTRCGHLKKVNKVNALVSFILEDKNIADFIVLILEANGVGARAKQYDIQSKTLLQELTPSSYDVDNYLILIIGDNWINPNTDDNINEVIFMVSESIKNHEKIVLFLFSGSLENILMSNHLDAVANLPYGKIIDVKKLGVNKSLDTMLSTLGCADGILDPLKPLTSDLPSNSRVKRGNIHLRELFISVETQNPEVLKRFSGLIIDIERGWVTRRLDDTVLVYLEIVSTNSELNNILDVLKIRRLHIHSIDKDIISDPEGNTTSSFETKFDLLPGAQIWNPATGQIEILPVGAIAEVEYYSAGKIKNRRYSGEFTVNGTLAIPDLDTVKISLFGSVNIEYDGIYDASIFFESV